MPELYKILDPKDVPAKTGRRPKGPLRLAMEQMEGGDTIAIPASQKNNVATTGYYIARRFSISTHGDLCYVRRLPDDAS